MLFLLFFIYSLFFILLGLCKQAAFGGDGGNRNHVRKSIPKAFYERIRYINIPSAQRLTTGFVL